MIVSKNPIELCEAMRSQFNNGFHAEVETYTVNLFDALLRHVGWKHSGTLRQGGRILDGSHDDRFSYLRW